MAVGGNRSLGDRGVETPDNSDSSLGSTRDRLIEAAADLFAGRGYERTSIQDVARRAGLTTGAIYSNFRDKRELLLAVIGRPSEALVSAVDGARRAGVSALEMLRIGGHDMILRRGSRSRPILVNALVLASRDEVVGERLRKGLGRTFRGFGRLLQEAQREGSIAADVDPASYVHYWYALSFGMCLLETAGVPPPDQVEWDRLMERLLVAVAGTGEAEQSEEGARRASSGDSQVGDSEVMAAGATR